MLKNSTALTVLDSSAKVLECMLRCPQKLITKFLLQVCIETGVPVLATVVVKDLCFQYNVLISARM